MKTTMKVIKQFVCQRSIRPGWTRAEVIAKEGWEGFVWCGGLGMILDMCAGDNEEFYRTRHLAIFGGAHSMATTLAKNAVYQLRGRNRLVIDDMLIHGLSGASITSFLFPPAPAPAAAFVPSSFAARFFAFAGIQALVKHF